MISFRIRVIDRGYLNTLSSYTGDEITLILIHVFTIYVKSLKISIHEVTQYKYLVRRVYVYRWGLVKRIEGTILWYSQPLPLPFPPNRITRISNVRHISCIKILINSPDLISL